VYLRKPHEFGTALYTSGDLGDFDAGVFLDVLQSYNAAMYTRLLVNLSNYGMAGHGYRLLANHGYA
jgi:hypothetical protein